MEDNLILTYSASPHIKNKRTTKNIMLDVCIALMPATLMGVIFFGLKALLLVVLSSFAAVASEFVYYLILGKSFKEVAKKFDFSSLVTGLLLALTFGTNYPWYALVLGSIFAVVVAKLLFGGTGKNIVNPAIAGRIFIFISFQSIVGVWAVPNIGSIFGGEIQTGATVIEDLIKNHNAPLSNLDLFLGTGLPGCIGETCKLALIIGGIYLVYKKVISPLTPVLYIVVTGLFTVILKGFDFTYFLPSILSGGLIIGAIFMATDYTTTPCTLLGNIIYFILLGVITAVLREATNMEVVSFAILLMNLTVPLFDKFITGKPFGYVKQKKTKGGKNVETAK